MKIGIVGLGVVGSALQYGFEKLSHEVLVHDIKLDTNLEDVLSSEVCYICVPTPSKDFGECDTSIVQQVVLELVGLNYQGIIAIKSTVKPGTTQHLIKQTGKNIVFCPEFLRERSASLDFVENHDLLAVGSHLEKDFDTIVDCHGHYPKSVRRLLPTEAELLKYMSNVYNAMKVVFANDMYEIAEKLNADYSKVKDAFIQRKTTVDMYLDVNDNFRGFAGFCLPKDTRAISSLCKNLGLDFLLFDAILRDNEKFKKTVWKKMRF
jgi:UDPglucose 6-dehydrogenase